MTPGGHDAGDDVLKHLVTVLQHSLRNIDILGRVGGEEFAILLPETTLEGARETAERLRVAVQDNPAVRVSPDGQAPLAAIPFTISLGVAAFDPEQTHTDELLKRADVAMYQAKATGRNKVCVSALSAKPMEQAS
jgi:diguanylate cyclase (GGDEF)-like protein